MSVDTAFVIFCDDEDCGRREFAMGSSAADARRYVEDYGWDHIDGDDLCPGHNETGGPF